MDLAESKKAPLLLLPHIVLRFSQAQRLPTVGIPPVLPHPTPPLHVLGYAVLLTNTQPGTPQLHKGWMQ